MNESYHALTTLATLAPDGGGLPHCLHLLQGAEAGQLGLEC